MILSNLPIILAERKLKITDVYKATGIARSTLTSLYYGKGEGVKFETLDVLCTFLKVSPGELLLHYPITLTILETTEPKFIHGEDEYSGSISISVDLKTKGVSYKEIVLSQGTVHLNNKEKLIPRFFVELKYPTILFQAYEEMPTIFQTAFTGSILDKMYELFSVTVDDVILESVNILEEK